MIFCHAECRYDECRYAECRYAERRGPNQTVTFSYDMALLQSI